jgi:hypothetical protein
MTSRHDVDDSFSLLFVLQGGGDPNVFQGVGDLAEHVPYICQAFGEELKNPAIRSYRRAPCNRVVRNGHFQKACLHKRHDMPLIIQVYRFQLLMDQNILFASRLRAVLEYRQDLLTDLLTGKKSRMNGQHGKKVASIVIPDVSSLSCTLPVPPERLTAVLAASQRPH